MYCNTHTHIQLYIHLLFTSVIVYKLNGLWYINMILQMKIIKSLLQKQLLDFAWLYRYYDYFMNKLIPYQSDKSLIYWISFLIVRFLWFSRNSKLLSIHQLFYMYFYTIPIFNVVFDPVHLMIWTNIYPYKCISLFPKLIVTHKAAITLIDLTSSKSINCLLYP